MRKKKKCKVPCDKLHRMDRNIRRILWRIQTVKHEDLAVDPTRNHIYVLTDKRSTYGYRGITMLESAVAHPYERYKEQPLDRVRNCRPSVGHIGIIKARKF